jgi:hypothetical protein
VISAKSNRYDPHKELPSTIENIAMERSFTTWRQVRKALASELMRSQAEVEGRYSWKRSGPLPGSASPGALGRTELA